MTLVQSYADYLGSTQARALGARDLHQIRRAFIDTIAVTIAGLQDRNLIALKALSPAVMPDMTGITTPVLDLTRLLATAAHQLDFDDVVFSCHPSAVLVPICLVAAAACGRSQAQMFLAYQAGYEVLADLCQHMVGIHSHGWHPTSVIGTVAAAASAAVLLQLDSSQSAHALAISSSLSSGLIANFGSSVKPLHAGHAAYCGLFAARLAQGGFTGLGQNFAEKGGFFDSFTRGLGAPPTERLPLGSYLARYGLNAKRYPTCYANHRMTDGLIEIATEPGFQLSNIERITISLGQGQIDILRHNHPKTEMEARFSAHFAAACALARGRLNLQDIAGKGYAAPEITTLYPKITLLPRTGILAENPMFSTAEDVVVAFKDGRTTDRRDITHAEGSAAKPLSETSLQAKFFDCLEGISGARTLYEALQDETPPQNLLKQMSSIIIAEIR